jgi:ADP-ribose pyrophosphatase YjhB (NUDIX family)
MSWEKPTFNLSMKRVGDSEIIVVSPQLTVHIDQVAYPNGTVEPYTYVYKNNESVAVVPVDKRRGQRSVLLIPQERYPSQTIGWEVPAGNPKEGETPLETGQRELAEEGKVRAELWEELPAQVENIGRGNSYARIFIATGMNAIHGLADDTEVLGEPKWFSMTEAEDLMLDGSLNSGHTITSIAMANAFLNHNPNDPITQIAG